MFPAETLWLSFAAPFRRGARARTAVPDEITAGGERVALRYVRHPRARRYVLRLGRDGAARVTVPRGGTLAAARAFVLSKTGWIEAQRARQKLAGQRRTAWAHGSRILLDGEEAELRVSADGAELELGGERVRLHPGEAAELRPAVKRHLLKRARAELPPRVLAAAAQHGLRVVRVVVRDQRSRWGSCSPRREISLNWRLLQAPSFVRDYLIVHELMHLREMNHGVRFWRHVGAACPGWGEAEAWLKRHNDLLRDGR